MLLHHAFSSRQQLRLFIWILLTGICVFSNSLVYDTPLFSFVLSFAEKKASCSACQAHVQAICFGYASVPTLIHKRREQG